MKKPLIILVLFFAALVQVSIFEYIRILGVKPDLMLAGVFWFSLAFQKKEAVVFSAGAGILKDIFAPYFFGFNTLLFILCSLFLIRLGREISLESNPVRFVVFYIVSFCNTVATRVIFFFLGNAVPLYVFLRVAFLGSLYTTAAALLAFRAVPPSEKTA